MLFLDGFENIKELCDAFNVDDAALENATVVIGEYTNESYDGSAYVLFERDGKFFEVHGSHCSCNGLEDQWFPEPVTIKDLEFRIENGNWEYNDTLKDAIVQVIKYYEFNKKIDKIIN